MGRVLLAVIVLTCPLTTYAQSIDGCGTSLQIGVGGWAGAVGDLDHDGVLDVIVEEDGDAFVHLGQMSASGYSVSFVDLVDLDHGASDFAEDMSLADLNGDGHPDLVAWAMDSYAIAMGGGDGTFAPSTKYTCTGSYWGCQVALGDIDGDGDIDLVDNADNGKLRVLHNDGLGTFTTGDRVSTWYDTVALVLLDADLDGDLDLVASDYDDSWYSSWSITKLYTNDGTGNLGSGRQITDGDEEITRHLVADLDSDGIDDFATVTNRGSLQIMRGSGAGTFSVAEAVQGCGWSCYGVESLTSGDMDGDGHPDLLVSGDSHTVFFMNSGHADIRGAGYLVNNAVREAIPADFDGVGQMDLMSVVRGNTELASRSCP